VSPIHGQTWAYGTAVASAFGIVVLDGALASFSGERVPSTALLLPVVAAAMLGGFAPGIFAAFVGAIAVVYMSPPPDFPPTRTEWVQLAFFFLAAAVIARLVGSRARALRESRDSRAALKEREARLELLLSGTEAAIWDWDVQRRRVSYSPRWKQLRGFAEHEVGDEEEAWSGGIYPDDRARVEASLQAHFRGETPVFEEEYRVRHKDGRWLWIQDRGIALRDSQGRVTRMTGSETDISERKETERALQASEQRLRRAIDEAPLPVVVHAEDGEILQLSRAFVELSGYTREELRSVDDWTRRAYGSRKESVDARISQLYKSNQAVDEGEFTLRTARGDERIWAFASSPLGLDARGRRLVISMAVDVTDRKRAERAVQDADRRKDEFLAVLGHELRNPLAPLRTGLELLGMQTLPENISKIHAMMERQVDYLAHLVDDLLDLARIRRGEIQLRCQSIDFNEVVDAAIELAMPGIERRQHSLIDDRLRTPLPMHGDPHRLAQVVSNLLNNAAKYMDAGGRIRVAAEAERGFVVLRVEDTGFGIPSEQLESVFEIFSQVPEHRVRTGGGDLGIGLAVSRQLVALHRGSITAHSGGLGRGSEFVLRLPLHERTAAVAIDSPGLPQGERRRILIVDDDYDAAASMGALLEQKGHRVMVVTDGPRALSAFGGFAPEVVLLDIGMPSMSGYEVARRMRGSDEGRAALLIAVTGWGQATDKERAQQAGFDEHLTKPVDTALLQTLIAAESTKRGAWLQPNANPRRPQSILDTEEDCSE
jgi:PAS domain S-box-containing protein